MSLPIPALSSPKRSTSRLPRARNVIAKNSGQAMSRGTSFTTATDTVAADAHFWSARRHGDSPQEPGQGTPAMSGGMIEGRPRTRTKMKIWRAPL